MNKLFNLLCILTFVSQEGNFSLATQYEYEIQTLTSIRAGTRSRPRCRKGYLPLDDFPEEVQRTQEDFSSQSNLRKMEICTEALQLDYCQFNKFKLKPKRKPGPGKTYSVRFSHHNQGRLKRGILVWAFKCPTNPPIYPRLNKKNQPVRVMVLQNNQLPFVRALRTWF